jgi:hypothetical protein
MSSELKNLGGRAYLVKKLQDDCGLSRRKATAVVNVILERMIKALKRGWKVEFPFGYLTRARRYFGDRWDYDDWPANRNPYIIEYCLDKKGVEFLYPSPDAVKKGRKKKQP